MALRQKPDLVLTDVMMPRLDGFGLLQELRADPVLRPVPVIMLSARAGEEARVEGLGAGADDYLIKPFSARELIARVGSMLELSRIRHEATQSRQALYESEEKFRLLADNMSQFAWMADDNGGILWYNRRWFDYTGTTFEEMQGWGWKNVLHPDHRDRVVAGMQRSWDAGEPWEDTFPLRGKDGEYRWFLSRARPIRNAEGRIVCWFGTNTDVTQRREAEAVLQATKEAAEAANRAKDHFLAVLSHELRTPLTPVLMAVQDMEADEHVEDHVRRELAMIRRNIELEARLIDDLLDLTRIEQGKLDLHYESVDLHAVLLHALETCWDSDIAPRRHRVHTELRASSPVIWADAARVEQVFWNLLKNAAKFTEPGGTITLRSFDDGDGRIIVQVADTGIGIAHDAMPHLFKAFEQGDRDMTQRYGGLGLGLTIGQAIVTLHRGWMRADSPGPDQGTTLTVMLPRGATPRRHTAAPEAPMQPRRGDAALRILLVDDHAPTLAVIARLLSKRGHYVAKASTVQEALALAEQEHFDLLISDLGLPDGTGHDLMRVLRQGRGLIDLKGIALSGYGREEDVRSSHEAGFNTHITKPVHVKMLEAAIARVFAAG